MDLNPIRAGINDKPENSEFTSIQERIHQYWSKTQQKPKKPAQYQEQQAYPIGKGLMKFQSKAQTEQTTLPISRKEYFELLDWTGRILRQNKKGKIPNHLKPILQRLDLNENQWIESLKTFRHRFFHVIGNLQNPNGFARKKNKDWIRGKGGAKTLYRQVA